MNTFSIAERAKYLRLAALTVSEGMRTGGFRSCFRGQGIEFDGVREYERGDDIRSIDWNVMARTGKPFVKLYREERELTVFLVVDDSLSMSTGSGSVSRREKALETAALLAFAAEQNASPVGSAVFDGEVGKSFSPRSGKDQVLAILTDLEKRSQGRNGSALAGALAGTCRMLRGRALVAILSDFRTTGYEKNLGVLARRHDVLAVRMVSPVDSSLPSAGYVPFIDPESGERVSFATGSSAFRAYWEREAVESIRRWEHLCVRRGVSPLLMSTEDDACAVLSRFFSGRRETSSWSGRPTEAV